MKTKTTITCFIALLASCLIAPIFAKEGCAKEDCTDWKSVHAKLRRLSFDAQINEAPKSNQYSSEIIELIMTETKTVFTVPVSSKIKRELKREINGLDRLVARFYKDSVYHTVANTERLDKLYDSITSLIMDVDQLEPGKDDRSKCDCKKDDGKKMKGKDFAKLVDEKFGDRMAVIVNLLDAFLKDKNSSAS